MTTQDEAANVTVRRWRVRMEFKPQDCWVGLFWKSLYDHQNHWPEGTPTIRRKPGPLGWKWVRTEFHLWVCVLPMVPLHISWEREVGFGLHWRQGR